MYYSLRSFLDRYVLSSISITSSLRGENISGQNNMIVVVVIFSVLFILIIVVVIFYVLFVVVVDLGYARVVVTF